MYAVIFWYLINKLYHWPHNFLFTYRNHHPKPPICLYTASCLYTIIFWSWFQKTTVSFRINLLSHLNIDHITELGKTGVKENFVKKKFKYFFGFQKNSYKSLLWKTIKSNDLIFINIFSFTYVFKLDLCIKNTSGNIFLFD